MSSAAMEREFFRGARLTTIIPDETDRNISEIIEEQDEEPEGDELLPRSKQRHMLFFDEILTIYIVLKLSIKSADLLESYISRLELKLDVWVASSPDANKGAAPHQNGGDGNQRELIFSGRVKKSEDPIVIIREDEDEANGQLTSLLLWETSITLTRPRVRFTDAAITIIPSGTYTPEQAAPAEDDNEYLPAFVSPQLNILGPLKSIRGLENNPPYLAASRLERVLPHTPGNDNIIRLAFLPSPPIRVVPSMIARLRCSRINTSSSANSTTIASLEIEIIPFVEIHGSLEQVEVSLTKGGAEPLVPSTIPMACRSRDCVTFLYKLHPPKHLSEPVNTGNLSVSLALKIFPSPHCTSIIRMDWTSTVDLSPSLNPSFGPPSQPIQRPQRPASLPLTTALSSLPPGQRTSTNLPNTGLTISITAPSTPIHLARPFTWSVLIVNHTSKPSKLALIPLPRIQRASTSHSATHSKTHAPRTSASFRPAEKRHTNAHTTAAELDLAQAVCDENIVYAMQHSNLTPTSTDLVSLTAELRVGPLGPGACHECEIRMVALVRGALRVDAIRVVDLVREAEEGPSAVGVVMDIRELPDVIVL